MATRLGLYNSALGECLGERTLASLSENREPRRVLDAIWDDGLVNYCLEQGMWNFAMRTVKLSYSPSVEPPFGYSRAFNKPDDFVRICGVCEDEYFQNPLTRYSDEAGFWFSDLDDIYIRYISNDLSYGNDTSLWPESFTKFVYTYMASRACKRITGDDQKEQRLEKRASKMLIDARSKDAMSDPTSFMPQGQWTSSRQGNSLSRHDRGSRGRLIG